MLKASPSAGLFYAETTVSGNASVTVTFTAPPVINSFTQNTLGSANFISFTAVGELLYAATFNWSASGADRYELIGPRGAGPRGAIYSGTATSYTWPKGILVTSPGQQTTQRETWTLRAWNGGSYTDRSIVITVDYQTDVTDPSG